MQYGHFDNENREYVIDRVDLPTSWTNYIGVKDMCAVLNHTAGGYIFYKSPEYHRITRFRPNGVPMDRPGHYVYLRDDESGDYWSVSWQPVGKPLDQAKWLRHSAAPSTRPFGNTTMPWLFAGTDMRTWQPSSCGRSLPRIPS